MGVLTSRVDSVDTRVSSELPTEADNIISCDVASVRTDRVGSTGFRQSFQFSVALASSCLFCLGPNFHHHCGVFIHLVCYYINDLSLSTRHDNDKALVQCSVMLRPSTERLLKIKIIELLFFNQVYIQGESKKCLLRRFLIF